jgi:hypothetical protein
VRDHRPELQRAEQSAVSADAILTIEDRPTVLDLEGDGDEQPDGRRQNDPGERQTDIERPLERRVLRSWRQNLASASASA